MSDDVPPILSDKDKYLYCMKEIKLRLVTVDDFLAGRRTSGYAIPDVELIFVQFRKIFELVCLSSLCAHKENYSKTEKQLRNEWNLSKICRDLGKINPHFFPSPIREFEDEHGVARFEPIAEGFMGKEEMTRAHGVCGDHLHAFNPYKGREWKIDELKQMFVEWKSKTVKLLNSHRIQLLDHPKEIWVHMEEQPVGKPVAYEMRLQRDDGTPVTSDDIREMRPPSAGSGV